MSEILYQTAPLYGWGRSFDMASKGHPIAKRVWRKKADLEEYLNNTELSAVSGMIVVILEDTPENNGAWLVERVPGDPAFTDYKEKVAKLTKLATGEVQEVSKITIADDSKQFLSISVEDQLSLDKEALRRELMSWLEDSFDSNVNTDASTN